MIMRIRANPVKTDGGGIQRVIADRALGKANLD